MGTNMTPKRTVRIDKHNNGWIVTRNDAHSGGWPIAPRTTIHENIVDEHGTEGIDDVMRLVREFIEIKGRKRGTS